MTMITQTRLREVLEYDPETGIFTWKVTLSNSVPAASRAGTLHPNGYVYIHIDRRGYLAHRLAWLYITGSWPQDQLDHINGVKNDNRWVNLREADNRLNLENQRKAHRNNKLGVLGVTPSQGKFRAVIRHLGHLRHLGYFATRELAHTAYLKAKRGLHAGNTL